MTHRFCVPFRHSPIACRLHLSVHFSVYIVCSLQLASLFLIGLGFVCFPLLYALRDFQTFRTLTFSYPGISFPGYASLNRTLTLTLTPDSITLTTLPNTNTNLNSNPRYPTLRQVRNARYERLSHSTSGTPVRLVLSEGNKKLRYREEHSPSVVLCWCTL